MSENYAEHPVAVVLKAVQEALRQRLDSSVYRAVDIYLVKFEGPQNAALLPPGTRLPAIGIKDGGSIVEQGVCNTDIWTINIQLQLWDSGAGLTDAAILGSSSQRGILAMERDIANALRSDRLGCMEGGWQIASAEPSVGGEAGGQDVQMKKITYQYIIEDKWGIN